MFTLKIDTRNDATQTGDDLGDLLAEVSERVRNGYRSAPIIDANGNTVGAWKFTGGAK